MSTNKLIVTLATVGLSTCSLSCAIDPAPPPFECPTDASKGVRAEGAIQDGDVIIDLAYVDTIALVSWSGDPQISNIQGATLVSAFLFDGNSAFRVTLTPDPGVTEGSFHITGNVTAQGELCPVDRTFTFKIAGSSVVVALRGELPLGAKERVTIAIARREERSVELAVAGAGAASMNGATAQWSATAGAIEPAPEGRVRWTLPEVPGLYQVELVVDRGRDGVHIDTLALEVT